MQSDIQNADTRLWGMSSRRLLISLLLAGLACLFLIVLLIATYREAPESNSYALLAQTWLNGRFDVDRCVDGDCALVNGLAYIIFPPLPAVITLPFVALFGQGFHFFMPLSIAAFAINGWMWWRMAQSQTTSRDTALLIVLITLFATPLFFVTLRGDHVWFFAQVCGFLFATAALYSALIKRNALLAGLFIGLAFLCRQMSILYLPFLYVLLLDKDTPWFRIDWAAIRRVMLLGAFPAAALAAYFAYNYARFGSPLETGYSYIFPLAWVDTASQEFLGNRVRDHGIFSKNYFLFNTIYMFLAGPHVDFGGRYLTQMTGFDTFGASPFLVTPVLFAALLARWDRSFWFGAITCGVILGLTLLYHSNGFTQYSAQRYILDWLPIWLVFLARGIRSEHNAIVSILVCYSMAVTLGMVVVGGVLAR